MGRLLQIRVLAQSPRPEDVESNWPTLAQLAWPLPRAPEAVHGVMELPGDLFEHLSHGDWPEERKEALRAGISKAMALKAKLEAALADWKPRDADALSYQLEDTLDELEKAAVAAGGV